MKKSVINSTFWITMSHAIQNLLSVVLQIVFARFITPYSYGIYKYLLSLISTLGSLTPGGISTALQHDAAKNFDGSLSRAFLKSINWSIVTFLGGLFVGIYYLYFDNYLFAAIIFLGTTLTCLNNGSIMYGTYLVSKKLFKENFYIFLLANIFSYSIVLPTIIYTQNIFIILCLYFITQAIVFFIAYLYTKNKYTYNDNVSGVFDKYSRNMSIASTISLIASNLDKIIIFHILGPISLAVFSYSQVFVENIRGLIKDYGKIFIKDYSGSNYSHIKKIVVKHSIYMFIFSLVIYLFYLLISPVLYSWLFPQYTDSIYYSNILAISILFSCFVLPVNALSQQAKQKELYDFNIYSGIFQIIINLVGAYTYGILGVVISNVLHRVWLYFYAMYLLNKN